VAEAGKVAVLVLYDRAPDDPDFARDGARAHIDVVVAGQADDGVDIEADTALAGAGNAEVFFLCIMACVGRDLGLRHRRHADPRAGMMLRACRERLRADLPR
jgi:hypothetical protein